MASPKVLPTVEELYEHFTPDFASGKLVWKAAPKHHGTKTGTTAGCVNGLGYVKVTLNGSIYAVHRVLWKMWYKQEPPPIIDHINRNKADNRICNLREVTASQNSHNSRIASHNTSGITGVSWHKIQKKYVVTKQIAGVDHYLGTAATVDEAKLLLNDWCQKRGFDYHVSPTGEIPEEWLS